MKKKSRFRLVAIGMSEFKFSSFILDTIEPVNGDG